MLSPMFVGEFLLHILCQSLVRPFHMLEIVDVPIYYPPLVPWPLLRGLIKVFFLLSETCSFFCRAALRGSLFRFFPSDLPFVCFPPVFLNNLCEASGSFPHTAAPPPRANHFPPVGVVYFCAQSINPLLFLPFLVVKPPFPSQEKPIPSWSEDFLNRRPLLAPP